MRVATTRQLHAGCLLCRRRVLAGPAAALQHIQGSADAGTSHSSHHRTSSRHFTAGSKISRSALGKMRVTELREQLQQEGLSTQGLKAELVERLYSLLLEGSGESSSNAQEELSPGSKGAASSHSHTAPTQQAAEQAAAHASTAPLGEERGQTYESTAAAGREASPLGARGVAAQGPSSAAGRPARGLAAPDETALATGLAVTWLGTSSGAPTLRRNVSCIALRTPGATFLVDSGEGTCRQVQAAGLDPSALRRLFVTHMHGDHCFGIGGLLQLVSGARQGTPLAEVPFYLFGPPGLHRLVAAQLGFGAAPLCMPLVVAELTTDPAAAHAPKPAGDVIASAACLGERVQLAALGPDKTREAAAALQRAGQQQQRGRRRRPGMMAVHEVDVMEGLTWTIPCEGGYTVTAAQLQHRVPCWGYVFQEPSQAPVPDPALLARAGVQEDVVLAAAKQGPATLVQLPNGDEVPVRELVRPPVRGRKVVLLGDTCNSRAILRVGAGADLLSHECTFAADMGEKAHIAQHSTAPMAGSFARQLGARSLVLTHFSGRFMDSRGRGADDDASAGDIQSLLRQARAAYGSRSITAAHDFYTFQVPPAASQRAAGQQPARGQQTQHEERRRVAVNA